MPVLSAEEVTLQTVLDAVWNGTETLHGRIDAVIRNAEEAAGIARKRDAATRSDVAVGAWLSAALEDPGSCEEFKAAVRVWFDTRPPEFAIAMDQMVDGVNKAVLVGHRA